MNTGTDLLSLLHLYAASNDGQPWFAATVVTKHRSSYRKPGALMLIDPLGRAFGLISGGCLEADIVLHSKKALFDGRARLVVYDSTEDGNIAAELGLGCNGRVGVLIQPLTDAHRAVLLALRTHLLEGHDAHLLQCFASDDPDDLAGLTLLDEHLNPILSVQDAPLPPLDQASAPPAVLSDDARHWALTRQRAPVNLWIVGGGIDAEPVANIAVMLGWRVTVVDHRAAYARENRFAGVEAIVRDKAGDFTGRIDADAVILMSHNLDMDAAWLAHCQAAPRLRYVGLLGPVERRDDVIARSGLNPDAHPVTLVHGPMGLDIGGELPESIAVSVIAQCHQVLAREDRL